MDVPADLQPDLTVFDYDTMAPLNAEVIGVTVEDGVSRTRIRIDGLGDRVPVVVTAPGEPRSSERCPAVLIGHGANTTKDDLYIQAPAARWARAGLVSVAADAPGHGERDQAAPFDVDAHLGERDSFTAFVRRHVVDHRRVLDLVETLDGIDRDRVGYLGFSMGTVLGVPLVAVDARIRAAVFTIGGSFGTGPMSPAAFAPLTAGRPVLQLNTVDDEIFGPAAVKSLFDALGDPKELVMFPGTHAQFGGAVFKAMWEFLACHLGVAAA